MDVVDEERGQTVFMANRELRVVPKGWQHPTREGATTRVQQWLRPVTVLPEQMPDVSGLAPEETEIVAYETTTEGTPISPPFPNTPEGRAALIAYCAEHCFTFGRNKGGAEAWAALLFGEDAAVTADGVVIANDEPR